MPNNITIDKTALLSRLRSLGDIGRNADGALTRLAASDADKQGRNQLVAWFEDAGLEVCVDRIGNIFGIWKIESEIAPLMMGSHIDSVINAGIFDGCYGVLSALSVIEAMKSGGVKPDRPLMVAVFTNEEGVRYTPDMMGSLVYAGGLDADEALTTVGIDGTILGEELSRIGYAGEMEPGDIVPSAFIEVHVEQGPVLEVEGKLMGAVANLQGIFWQKVTIRGVANHAGTTPTRLRTDAGLAAAKVITYLRGLVDNSDSVATVGTIEFGPNVINVIPDFAKFTVDLRDPDLAVWETRQAALVNFLAELEKSDGVTIETEQLARFEPVVFDENIVQMIEEAAAEQQFSCRRMTSGAGHDAQMMARICPTAMIFVPSRDGISHNPLEHTEDEALVAGTKVLLDTATRIVTGS
ncbi:Zn-dependent hydrolase [Pseudovibrio sp. Tun.PSC04-5.I4]|uniref:Zn-dependent hydrolase n=1 Tax=Pseudovibrio sp. Tun.PSC04-5.I4 TaxID=1798213 RepID=UPI000B817821|nr:Zn-dependent hydrolase [Pseudovibrio sp. Tun.PSC04-5.I4]